MKNTRPFLVTTLVFLAILAKCGSAVKNDYYWRDYTGDVPEDAVPAGRGTSNQTIFIGQALILKKGNQKGQVPVNIHKGYSVVKAELFGVHIIDEFIKILCSRKPENFEWLSARSSNFHTVTIGKHLVAGGVEEGHTLYIGRTRFKRQTIIGKVLGGHIGYAKMYFTYENEVKSIDKYQVLIYNEIFHDIDLGSVNLG